MLGFWGVGLNIVARRARDERSGAEAEVESGDTELLCHEALRC